MLVGMFEKEMMPWGSSLALSVTFKVELFPITAFDEDVKRTKKVSSGWKTDKKIPSTTVKWLLFLMKITPKPKQKDW